MYKEADAQAQKGTLPCDRRFIDILTQTAGPASKLQNRLLFHLAHKFNDEKRLMGYHQNLQDVVEDQVFKPFHHLSRIKTNHYPYSQLSPLCTTFEDTTKKPLISTSVFYWKTSTHSEI